ncbi:phosphatidylserine receptor [Babesia ovis]|uniref:Phosphatidylserine receptor n=1 Tax=Babesia ovis TaxID=5869 RepID=A0A9W5WVL2_BABOV|nr:phosphatidylserine receptor [Babesia ovis]
MSYYSKAKVLVIAVHMLLFIGSLIAVEIFLRIRGIKEDSPIVHRPRGSIHDDMVLGVPTISVSRRSLGTFAFGLSCMAGFGFVLILCTRGYLSSKSDISFFDRLWDFDVIICNLILFNIAPAGLCHKYINITSTLTLSQRLCRVLAFVLVWNSVAWLLGRAILSEMFFKYATNAVPFIIRQALQMCGFGLSFIAMITGFTSIYVPYRVYMTRKDVLTTTQLDNRIADATMAIRQLRAEKRRVRPPVFDFSSSDRSDSDDTEEEEMVETTNGFFRTSGYMDRLEHGTQQDTQPSHQDNWADEQCISGRSTDTKMSQDDIHPPVMRICSAVAKRISGIWEQGDLFLRQPALLGSTRNTKRKSVGEIQQLQAYIRQERAYLLDIKKQRELWKTTSGKMRLFVRYFEVFWAIRTLLVVSYRVLRVRMVPYAQRCQQEGNTKALLDVYHLFIKDNMVQHLISNLFNFKETPSYLDLMASRISNLLLLVITIGNLDHFFEFCRILLNTQYFHKRRLLTDNSLGLALSAFLIITVPSQFCLMVPFLPPTWRGSSLDMLFDKDAIVWVGLQYWFDTCIVLAMIMTLIGVTVLHYRRPKYYTLRDQIVCNV